MIQIHIRPFPVELSEATKGSVTWLWGRTCLSYVVPALRGNKQTSRNGTVKEVLALLLFAVGMLLLAKGFRDHKLLRSFLLLMDPKHTCHTCCPHPNSALCSSPGFKCGACRLGASGKNSAFEGFQEVGPGNFMAKES